MIKQQNNQKGVDPAIMSFELKQIGVIRTPYTDNAPYQPVEKDEGDVIETMSFYLKAIKNLGFTGFIDCTPAYLGRNVKILLQLSRILDIHILTNTGYYGAGNDRYIPRFAYEEDKNKLASLWRQI